VTRRAPVVVRKCDLCRELAIADVKLNASYGGQWGYVCEKHFEMRYGDAFVTFIDGRELS
jgi:hypothetical protein